MGDRLCRLGEFTGVCFTGSDKRHSAANPENGFRA